MSTPIGSNGRNESHQERCDRNLVELLQEVRVAQTGIQVLFAFLLGLAFTSRFATATTFQRVDYFVTLIAAGVGALLLIAPTSYHRLLFRRGDKEHLVAVANRFVIGGLACVAVAMVGVVLLASDLLFGGGIAIAAAGTAAIACLVTWYAMPLARRRRVAPATPDTSGRPSARPGPVAGRPTT